LNSIALSRKDFKEVRPRVEHCSAPLGIELSETTSVATGHVDRIGCLPTPAATDEPYV